MNKILALVALSASLTAQSGFVVPAANAAALGNAQLGFPFSYTQYVRLQQAIGTNHFVGPTVLHGMALRSRTNVLAVPEVQNQGMEVRLSDSLNAVNALSGTYANNVGANVALVFNSTFNIQRPNGFDALEFNTLIPFNAPYLHLNLTPLLIDLVPTTFMGQACTGGGNGTSFDAVTDPTIGNVSGKSGAGCPSLPTTNGFFAAGGFVLKFWGQNELFPFGKACGSTGVATIASTGGLPTPGNAGFALKIGSIPAGTPPLAAMILGSSNQIWAANPLPYSLNFLNMTSCFLNASIDFSITLGVAGGSATMPLPVPMNLGLVGQIVYAQGVAVANGANPMNVITTQGGHIIIR
jgi:hypothetical protein